MIQKEMKKRENFEKSRNLTQETKEDARIVETIKWQCTSDSFVISSSNKWKKAFDALIVILAVYSTYSSTYLYLIKFLKNKIVRPSDSMGMQ